MAGVPEGDRIAGLTCSGGAAAMLADYAQVVGLRFPPPTGRTAERLAQCLPHTATVSNPLDYTTPIWGVPERVRRVFEAMLEDPCDAAVIVQDYPLEGLDESKDSYLNDAREFTAATRAAGVPAAVCSTLPENIDPGTREMLIAQGVVPMQGIRETLDAIAGAVWHGRRREWIRRGDSSAMHAAPGDDAGSAGGAGVGADARPGAGAAPVDSAEVSDGDGSALDADIEAGVQVGVGGGAGTGIDVGGEVIAGARSDAGPVVGSAHIVPPGTIDEHQAKLRLRRVGMPVPSGRVAGSGEAPEVAKEIGFPVAVKMLSDRLPHKMEAGAVALGVRSPAEVETVVARIRTDVIRHDASAASDRFLIEQMVETPLAELLVNVRRDPRFGARDDARERGRPD